MLKLTGSRRAADRPLEPMPEPGTPVCPEWLQGEARSLWGRIVPELVELGVMTKLDGFAFSRYCVYCVLWLKELNNPGRTEATLERYAGQLQKLETSFGLTPAARRGIEVRQPEETDPLEELLRRRHEKK